MTVCLECLSPVERKALERDLIGWSMTNTTRIVAPLWGAERMLGTNPIAIAFPAGEEPPVVIDSAHNRDSARRLRETLDEYFSEIPVILIFCALQDKDIAGMLEELKPRLECVVATRADHPRAPSAEWIAEQVREVDIPVEAVTPTDRALERALDLAGEEKLILAAGSVAFAGEVSAAWHKRTG